MPDLSSLPEALADLDLDLDLNRDVERRAAGVPERDLDCERDPLRLRLPDLDRDRDTLREREPLLLRLLDFDLDRERDVDFDLKRTKNKMMRKKMILLIIP